eukprot:m.168761 g.168761  ORF g.168761 m.168761 type:complete len:124 (+) comp53212_c0_seq31:751-1122(+)
MGGKIPSRNKRSALTDRLVGVSGLTPLLIAACFSSWMAVFEFSTSCVIAVIWRQSVFKYEKRDNKIEATKQVIPDERENHFSFQTIRLHATRARRTCFKATSFSSTSISFAIAFACSLSGFKA